MQAEPRKQAWFLLRRLLVVRTCVFCLTAALTLACAACGNKDNLYPVSGKVTYKGAPASGAAVFFYRRGGDSMNEHMIMSLVQEDGTFELVCGSLGKGAPPGEYDVVVEWKQVSGQIKGRPERGPDKLEGRYADPKHPRLQATIKAERNELPPFNLMD
jgi:hypothetical protein